MSYLTLTKENLNNEHICCAFSDKKCKDSYEAKKTWIKKQLEKGFVFTKLNERAKVFIEYIDGKYAWAPIKADEYIFLGCFWVSGKYKGQGHGKKLLNDVIAHAKEKGKKGLVTIAGKKKFTFMSDSKWLLKQGFKIIQSTEDGFALYVLKFDETTKDPCFNESINSKIKNQGCVVYYSNRCPYSQFHVEISLKETCKKRKIPLTINKLESLEQARNSPCLATIFSLYLNGKFITTDISACMDSKFDKIVNT